MISRFALALLIFLSAAPSGAQPAQPDPLGPLRSLVGHWQGTSEGQPGRARVEREYAELFGSRFIHAQNRSTYAPQEKNPKGEIHEDRGVFSFDTARKRIVFRQFHVEGFVNQYVMEPTASAAAAIVFTTEAIENIPAGWRARETYRFSGPDEFEEVFELAAPGKEFELYSRARFMRVRQGGNDRALVPALQPFAFLLGSWDADPGRSGETGGFTFSVGAQGHVILRTNYANYPAPSDKPASRHDDLMVIAPDGNSVRADYFDSEGHVIRYAVQTAEAGQAVFLSDLKPNEPRYRLRYAANKDGSVTGVFDVAPPGAPTTFNAYLTWTARRRP